jgi:hypothetical protein
MTDAPLSRDAALDMIGHRIYDELAHAGFSANDTWSDLAPDHREIFKDIAERLLAHWDQLSQAREALERR